MAQLDLFEDAPRDYNDALRSLVQLDTTSCHASLERHRKIFPNGRDIGAASEACRWLDALPPPQEDSGVAYFLACRALREGRAPGFQDLGSDTGPKASRALARRILAAVKRKNPADQLNDELPWAVFHFFAGNPAAARPALASWAEGNSPAPSESPLSSLALADALWELGRRPEALVSYRNGYGLAPAEADWPVHDTGLAGLRRETQTCTIFSGDWWVVGAYLDGGLPPFGKAIPTQRARWLQHFNFALQDRAAPPIVFFLGLRLSEQGLELGFKELARVRETLRRLHPEAWELHRARLET